MAFRYENAGDGADFLTSVTALDVDKTKSLTGKAFYGSERQIDNLNTPAGIKEIWFKFDLYIDSAATGGNRFSFGHYSSALGGYVGIWNNNNTPAKFLCDAKPATALDTGLTGTLGKINRVLLHMVSDATNGLIELTVNGATYTYTGNVNDGADFDTLYFYSSGANMLFSNIIVADSEIHGYEGMNSTEFDLETQISYGLRGWRYFNPGDADLLAVTGATTVNTDFSQSVTGKAFYGGSQVDMFNTPELSEVWMRFDMYFEAVNSISRRRSIACGFYSVADGRYIGFSNINIRRENIFSLTGGTNFDMSYYADSFNRCLLHIKTGEQGCVELTINGNTITYTGTVNAGQPTDTLYLYCDNSYCVFSNVTVSDSPLTMDEGYRRDLFSVETEVTAPVLNVRWQGENHQFYPTTKKSTPAVAVRVGDRNFYAPLVNDSDTLASAVRLLLDDTNRALST